ncbi:MAG: peptide chain release factor N(5)-glutamine methyltransferase [Gammaproteobacteria bacterium]|nr:peptide chain release factor N(5)-glutamine methyltransferase [Gammaproteobacteria bacterium]
MITIHAALQQASTRLEALPHSSPQLEAAVLLCHVLEKPRSYLFTWPDKTLTQQAQKDYQSLLTRRLQGEPVAHITGRREFWSLTLKVGPDTLIPRPETELLVEQALLHLQKSPSPKLADLGTGCGAIALAVASERPDCTLHATDRHEAALKIARENIANLALQNVRLLQGDWFQALPAGTTYDLILSNPPYIADLDPHLQQGDLPREPISALTSGADGLDDIRIIASQALNRLKPAGWLLLEHGFDQGSAVRRLLTQAGFDHVRTLRDLSGQERISEGKRPE